MNDIPPWLNTLLTLVLIPAFIAIWRWYEKRDSSRIGQAVDRMEHLQNADDEIRHAYLVSVAKQSEQVATAMLAIQQGLTAQNAVSERQTVILDGIMRTQISADLREQERDRVLRALLEQQQRQSTILATFAPQLFAQPGDARPWEKREADAHE